MLLPCAAAYPERALRQVPPSVVDPCPHTRRALTVEATLTSTLTVEWARSGRPPAHVTRARRARFAELCATDLATGRTARVDTHAALVGLKPSAALRLLADPGFVESVNTIAGLIAALDEDA